MLFLSLFLEKDWVQDGSTLLDEVPPPGSQKRTLDSIALGTKTSSTLYSVTPGIYEGKYTDTPQIFQGGGAAFSGDDIFTFHESFEHTPEDRPPSGLRSILSETEI